MVKRLKIKGLKLEKTHYCSKCGIRCSDKMKIQARKNKDYIFCTDCFNFVKDLDMKEIRKLIKNTTLK